MLLKSNQNNKQQNKLKMISIYNSGNFPVIVYSIIIICTICLLIEIQHIDSKKCSSNDEQEMEQCAIKLETLTDDKFKFPKNLSDMKDFCHRLSKNHDCVNKYVKDCLGLVSKLMAAPVLKNLKESLEKKICKNDESKKDLLKRISCGNENNLIHFQRLVRASIARLEHLNQSGANSTIATTTTTTTAKPLNIVGSKIGIIERAPFVCCSLRLFQEDIKNTTQIHCSNKQSADDMSKFLIDLTQGAAGSLLDMFCSNYKSLSDCNKPDNLVKYLNEVRDITTKVKNGTSVPKNKAILPVVFKLV